MGVEVRVREKRGLRWLAVWSDYIRNDGLESTTVCLLQSGVKISIPSREEEWS